MSEKTQAKEEKMLPSVPEFCVKLPLYAEHSVDPSEASGLYDFITEQVTMDCFCVECEQPSVLIAPHQSIDVEEYKFHLEDRIFTRDFYCSRVNSHISFFHFRLKEGILQKIGQSPSMADLSETDLRSYRAVLSKDEYQELSRAVGLVSHGVGIGSFVYLRRIFERLIEEAHAQAAKDTGWDEGVFQKSRMEEKIELLKSLLPPFLVEQRKLYSILSKGIHSLTEEECLEAFPVVRMGIELILDQKLAVKKQQQKMDEIKKHLGTLHQKHVA